MKKWLKFILPNQVTVNYSIMNIKLIVISSIHLGDVIYSKYLFSSVVTYKFGTQRWLLFIQHVVSNTGIYLGNVQCWLLFKVYRGDSITLSIRKLFINSANIILSPEGTNISFNTEVIVNRGVFFIQHSMWTVVNFTYTGDCCKFSVQRGHLLVVVLN